MGKRIFISYVREDKEVANFLFEKLKEAGHEPWLDIKRLDPGQKWRDDIKQEIKKCDFFIVLISRHSMNKVSPYQAEIKIAIEHSKDFPPQHSFIIPIRLDNIKIEYSNLQDLQWVSLNSTTTKDKSSWLEVFGQILNCINKDLSNIQLEITSKADISGVLGDKYLKLQEIYKYLMGTLEPLPSSEMEEATIFMHEIKQRNDFINASIQKTIETSRNEIWKAIQVLKEWMVNGSNVRIIGAGRAKLAGSIPANRLAHGGARVSIVDDIIPMPAAFRQGGVIAVSASGKTPTVNEYLKNIRKENTNINVLGIAYHRAPEDFTKPCNLFIGIHLADQYNPLRALADIEEYVISMLLDAMVVAAGKVAGFDDTMWRLGHEDIGPTGPYSQVNRSNVDLQFSYIPSDQDAKMNVGLYGRDSDKSKLTIFLNSSFENQGKNALCIYGEKGIGKTSLAYSLFQEISQPQNVKAIKHEFNDIIAVNAYMTQWDKLLTMVASKLRIELPLKSQAVDIEKRIVDYIIKNRTFVLMDNVDDHKEQVLELVRKLETARNSFIMFTIYLKHETNKNFLTNTRTMPSLKLYELKGIDGEDAIKCLLGNHLSGLLTKYNLWNKLDNLKGNPQKLLYLKWLSPTEEVDLVSKINDLSTKTSDDVIESALRRMTLPTEHFDCFDYFDYFLALGLIRNTEFDSSLPAFLWDRLDKGSTSMYVRLLEQLISERLLVPVVNSKKYRISALVHPQMDKLFNSKFNPDKKNLIQYFIGRYFRDRFALKGQEEDKLDSLENCVYHYWKSDNIEAAYAHVFGTNILHDVYTSGLALRIKPILGYLDQGLSAKIKQMQKTDDGSYSDSKMIRITQMLAQTKVELGHVFKDLCQFEEAFTYMDKAKQLLNQLPSMSLQESTLKKIHGEIDHYQGIACSQIGRTLECLDFYFDAVRRAAAEGTFSTMDALSLGYLAYEMKFYDINQAEDVGKWAVDLSHKLGACDVEVKNLCSLGQIQSFAGKFDESAETFLKTTKLCEQDKIEKREKGRILVNSMVTSIGKKDFDDAKRKAIKAESHFCDSEDQRRRWMAIAYSGIAHYRASKEIGAQSKGQDEILDALKNHRQIGAQREAIYEALSWIWMKTNGAMNNVFDVIQQEAKAIKIDHSKEALNRCLEIVLLKVVLTNSSSIKDEIMAKFEVVDTLKKILQGGELQVFVKFWENHYKPTLLTSQN